ncbi:MAG: trypsin-like peptidase domain-containing protein [Saprospiraceae bacterium]|nr:trypsin-like peptidase domain-containing protein [Saprospiraceae bacterium]
MKYLFFAILLLPEMGWGQESEISLESVQSLLVEAPLTEKLGMRGTGFVIKSKTRYYLITNWHIVTHRNAWDNSWMDEIHVIPDSIKIMHNSKGVGNYSLRTEALLDKDKKPLYHVFRSEKSIVDVVAIPLKDTIGLDIYPVNYSITYSDLRITPTNMVFVVGFPKGKKFSESGNQYLPIWKSGTIASEPDVNEGGKPIIWLDLQGYTGMSGSPVYFITREKVLRNGGRVVSGTQQTFFMGVFSHIAPEINLGALWKSTFLKEKFDSLP